MTLKTQKEEITSKTEYAYTKNENPGTPTRTINYTYDSGWKDLPLTYDGGPEITYDPIGNPLNDGVRKYTWEEGRNLAKVIKGTDTISFKYNDSGIRYEKTVNGVTTRYHLVGDRVTYETNGTDSIYYTYDTWGKLISVSGTEASTVGEKNPYRYRGYRYDTETGLYYLQSRYYNPEWGRFINADILIKNGTGLLAHNLYAYCINNPVNMYDSDGLAPKSNEVPPEEAGYKAPKKGAKRGTAKNGKKGWVDKDGNVWTPDPSDHGGEHWDVQYPNGGYDNVYRDGKVRAGKGGRGKFSPAIVPLPQPNAPPIQSTPNPYSNPSSSTGNSPVTAEDVGVAAGGATAGVVIYWIISEVSRLFPPRNLIPVP